jgi:hypothetical protein
MWSATQVDEPEVSICGDLFTVEHLAGLDTFDYLHLELVAGEHLEGLLACHGDPLERLVLGDDGFHPLLHSLEVLRSERMVDPEVIVEAVLDRRPDGEGGPGELAEDRLGHHVRRRVPENVQALRIGECDHREVPALGYGSGEVEQLLAHFDCHRSLGEAGSD